MAADYKMVAFGRTLANRLMTRSQIDSLKRHVPWPNYLSHPSVTAAKYTWPIDVAALSKIHVADARLYANRSDALDQLPKGGIVAEIGVAAGEFSDVILTKLSPRRFDAFDIFRLHEAKFATGLPTAEMFSGMSHLEYYRHRFAPFVDQGVVRVIVGDSVEQLSLQPDASYDVIYIDGDHSYEGVLRDAELASLKLKQDGILIFNDYVMKDCFDDSPYGVVPVVNDFCVNRGWAVVYLALQRHMFCDIALKRMYT
jgi:Methyltransferase domain